DGDITVAAAIQVGLQQRAADAIGDKAQMPVDEGIVAISPIGHLTEDIAYIQRVPARARGEVGDLIRGGAGGPDDLERVQARAAGEGIAPRAIGDIADQIVAIAAIDTIVAGDVEEGVVAGAAAQRVAAVAAFDTVIAVAARDRVVAVLAIKQVVA